MVDRNSSEPQPTSESSSNWIVAATVGFAFFLVAVVVLANSGAATSHLLDIVSRVPGRDKTLHFLLMGTMALLLNLSWRGARWQLGPLPVLKGSVVVAAIVTLEEFSQWFVPIRSFSLEDLAYDYLGIALIGQSALLYFAWRRRAGARAQSDA